MSPGNQRQEHRWDSRVNVNMSAALRSVYGLEATTCVRNVSLRGAFVETGLKPALLSRVAIRPLRTGGWMEARVIRVEGAGLAVEWLEPGSPLALAMLLRGVAFPGGKPVDATRNERSAAELEWSVQTDALARARSEVDSGEFDVQG